MTVTPSPQSVVVPVGPKRVLVLKSAVERLILAADMYGVAHLDSDDMDDDAVELQDATEGMKDAIAAATAPSSLAGGEVHEAVALEVRMAMQDEMMASDANGGRVSQRIARANRAADTILAALSPEAPALNTIGCAELEVGRAVYERIEKLIDATTGPEAEELSYLAHLAASVEEVGGYDGPEAPARERVLKACADFQEAIDYFEADVADALAEDSERADLWDREVTVNIDALKTVMRAALTPRHEASAETVADWQAKDAVARAMGAVLPTDIDWQHIRVAAQSFVDCLIGLRAKHEAPAEGAGEDERKDIARIIFPESERVKMDREWGGNRNHSRNRWRQALEQADTILALRARSSAPEAREEALGNLLAVIHGDGGHRALEVGTKQAALEAEKIVAGLFAATSADKLRTLDVTEDEIAVLLEVMAYAGDEVANASAASSLFIKAEALAALKAEG